MRKLICGIQQVGIGVKNAAEAFLWYKKHFKTDVKVFEDAATAELMLPYTGGEPRSRKAILAINMQGGGGFEIWQYTSRDPQAAKFEIALGDLGINIIKIKCRDVEAYFNYCTTEKLEILSNPSKNPNGLLHFYLNDPYGNKFEIIEDDSWFLKNNDLTGGVAGVSIGVTDIEKALKLYKDILGYDNILFDKTDNFSDLGKLKGANNKFRRVGLRAENHSKSGFGNLLCSTTIELFQAIDSEPKKIFEDRFWGDLGYIHLCFDVKRMNSLEKEATTAGFPFTVNSKNTFGMGEAAGHFSYVEDPDGTLIEFVETHKVPIFKKLGIYLNLKKRNDEKPLPNWLIRGLSLNRVK